MAQEAQYTEDNIRSLEWDEHIRLRPGMYIGKLGDGKSPDDGIYILLKEILDNSIDEYVMGARIDFFREIISLKKCTPARLKAVWIFKVVLVLIFDQLGVNAS